MASAFDKELLNKSFSLVLACVPDFTHHFYASLFLRHPEARSLFHRQPLPVQEKLLLDMLSSAVRGIDDLGYLARALGPLGARHVEYGVTPEMYAWVGEALIATLAHVSGCVWSAELEALWVEAYARMTAAMSSRETGAGA